MKTIKSNFSFSVLFILCVGISCSYNSNDDRLTLTQLEKKLSEISSIQNQSFKKTEIDSLWARLIKEDQIPFKQDTTALFLFYGEADSVSWQGDFNSWDSDKGVDNTGTEIENTNIWTLKTSFPEDARIDYKISVDDNWIIDPVNPHYQWSGFGPNSELRMPEWEPEPLTQRIPEAKEGSLSDNILINSSNLGYATQYQVYTPVGYENLTDLPVLYIFDGQEYADDRLGAAVIMLDNLIHLKKIDPVVAVFIDPTDPDDPDINRRSDEYAANPDYNNFFLDELMPEIRKSYKVSTKRNQTALLGTSLGALNATYLGFTNPDVFGKLAIQAPAYWYREKEIYGLVRETEQADFDIYMSVGTIGDNLNDAQRMSKEFDRLDLDYTYTEVNEGHSWGAWSAQIDDILIQFFKK